MVPVINHLTHPIWQAIWESYLSAEKRAITCFFAFWIVNYCFWASVHYEECLSLSILYSIFYQRFACDKFEVHESKCKEKSLPTDQALKRAYVKPAKGPGGNKTFGLKWTL